MHGRAIKCMFVNAFVKLYFGKNELRLNIDYEIAVI